MEAYTAKALLPLIQQHGRTVFDEPSGTLFFNWTCSGFTVAFTGKSLRAKIQAYGDQVAPPPGSPPPPADYPWVGVVEDGDNLARRVKCTEGAGWYELFSAPQEGRHTLRVIKLSENARGKAGLLALETDGAVLPADSRQEPLSIEFIGDSITCGFGNEAPGRDAPFDTSEENGWMSFGAVAGRRLGAAYNMVSVSGIATHAPKHRPPHGKSMAEVYGFSDIYLAERLGREPERWDFHHHKKDIVVINLGTNDVAPIRFYTDLAVADEEERYFEEKYREFIGFVRKCNGPDAWIVCTLGPLDYYLYSNMERAVAQYQAESGDSRVRCFRLVGVNLMTEGYGAISHPSLKTQARMGEELATRLRGLLP